MYREEDIAYEGPNFWVLNVGDVGFEVYRKTVTHSERVASCGPSFGLERAIAECERRELLLKGV